jgi:hypothetical protein
MTWKKVIVAQFKVLFRNLPGQIKKNHKSLCKNNWSLGQDLNLGRSEYEGVLTIRLERSVSLRDKRAEKYFN